jgi:DNA-3-methyladenine glycosylase
MSHKPLPSSFYDRPTLTVARELLGCELWVRKGRSVCAGRLVEVEAYIGEEDPACHAHRGMTPRNRVMYGPPGFAYVYFTYGNHWMLNFVAERAGFPAAVLIRGIEPLEGIALMRRRRRVDRDFDLTNGPGKLTAAFGITGADNGVGLTGGRFTVLPPTIPVGAIEVSGRIGVNEGHDRPWRFYLEGNPWVSRYRLGAKSARSRPR